MTTTYNISSSLATMFVDKSQPTRQEALMVIINTRIIERESIREHMLKMIITFKEIELLGTIIDLESQVDMVLETFSDSFSLFS
jgi:hypothetical protein